MKKSVVLAIMVIYVFAIVVVGLWGIKTYFFNPTVYVSEIKLVDSEDGAYKVETTPDQPDVDYIRVDYKKDLKFQLYYRVLPDDASNKTVEFDFDISKYVGKIEITEVGEVLVYANERMTIDGYIRSRDGVKAKSRKIRIMIRVSESV